MVSQSEHIPITTGNTPVVTDDRGIREHTTAVAYPGAYVGDLAPRYHSFWGAVIAGSLTAIAIFVLSFALMFGCGVGVNAAGALIMSWGSAVWICVTSAIALYVGGMIASLMTRPIGLGWAYGLGVWGLTVPLSFVLAAIVAAGSGIAYGLNTAQAVTNNATRLNFITVSNPVAWTLFVALAVGLIFGIIGGMSASATDMRASE